MKITFQPAQTSQLDLLLTLGQAFCLEDNHPFEAEVVKAGFSGLLSQENMGRVWLILADNTAIGYLVLTLGYRLAYGRYAFIDEIYVRPAYRQQGIGRRAIAWAEATCTTLGVKALHLEVEQANVKAHALYTRLGFSDFNRYLLTCWPSPVPANQTEATTGLKLATSADIERLLNLRQPLNAQNIAAYRARLAALLADVSLGRVWLIQAEGQAVGYLVLTFGYSLEFHGQDALLDEAWFADAEIGLPAVRLAQQASLSWGVNAIHIELERQDSSAQVFYHAAGFEADDSYLLTKWLSL
jgi:GNAT superfamily N-acetyltransferase